MGGGEVDNDEGVIADGEGIDDARLFDSEEAPGGEVVNDGGVKVFAGDAEGCKYAKVEVENAGLN